MRRLLSLAMGVVFIAAACGDSDSARSDDPWEQNWILHQVETSEGVNGAATTPVWVQLRFEPLLRGNDGCGQFQGTYEYEDPALRFPAFEYLTADPSSQAVRCPGDIPIVVEAMRTALRDGVVVTSLTADLMTWRSGDITFEFHAGLEG